MSIFFFFNDTATTEIYPLSLHDALPIYADALALAAGEFVRVPAGVAGRQSDERQQLGHSIPRRLAAREDRKSTRLNSSHGYISYAVFCLKKKNNPPHPSPLPWSPTPPHH